ncbi:MAG TPA: hypothetical protein VLK56_01035 [Solirubrobacterales bacterium]|nr:hypothetical protein [Solirubrobacterales bacterium]
MLVALCGAPPTVESFSHAEQMTGRGAFLPGHAVDPDRDPPTVPTQRGLEALYSSTVPAASGSGQPRRPTGGCPRSDSITLSLQVTTIGWPERRHSVVVSLINGDSSHEDEEHFNVG